MTKSLIIIGLLAALLLSVTWPATAERDGFESVVRAIEQFYHVKHQSLPLIARAGMKAVRTAATMKGGEYKKLAEAGSVRVAFFEDQTFDSRGQIASFKASVQQTLAHDWSPLMQTLAPKTEEQTYIYVRDAGQKFHVIVITIEKHEATVIQATLAPEVLADLMKNPDEMGRALTDNVTTTEP
jgi:hypothetical protein